MLLLDAAKNILNKLRIPSDEVTADEKGNVVFPLSVLNQLTLQVPDIADLGVDTVALVGGVATATSHIVLSNGIRRTNVGICIVGSRLYNGELIDNDTAVNVAKSRAVRAALNSVNFDPDRILSGEVELVPRDEFKAKQRQIHALKAQLQMSDDTYKWFLNTVVGKTSTSEMNVDEICLVAARMQAMTAEGYART